MECVVTYCDSPTMDPNNNGLKYNFTWDGNVVNLNDSVDYQCRDRHRHEGEWDEKHNATKNIKVTCGENGDFIYPDPWLQCSRTIICQDPGNSSEITRVYKTNTQNLEYNSVFKYSCDDKRKWLKHNDGFDQLEGEKETRCLWKKIFDDSNMTDLVCEIHHCRHPHDELGSHQPPPLENNLLLKAQTNWNVDFGDHVTYECPTGMHFENEEIDPTQTKIAVKCKGPVGEYETPFKLSNEWPNCTETVVCGNPPEPPVNGSRTWISPAIEDQETYDTKVIYACQDGSQFDTDGDGIGDSVTVEIRCQWNKQWFPYTELPTCIVTHCVEPFKIPSDSGLEELTPEWTPIYTYKHYQCKNHVDSVPTMFWETDRSRSTFKFYCNPTGYFTWKDWPKCLTGLPKHLI